MSAGWDGGWGRCGLEVCRAGAGKISQTLAGAGADTKFQPMQDSSCH